MLQHPYIYYPLQKNLEPSIVPFFDFTKILPPPPPPSNKWGGGGSVLTMKSIAGRKREKRAKLLSYMYKKSHDMDNAMKILELSFNERRRYLASSVDFFYVPLLILKTILRFSEKRWRWQLKGSYTSLVIWQILPWGTNKINIPRFSSNLILRCFFGIAINNIKHSISEGSLLLKCSVLFGSVVLSFDPSSIVTSLMQR